MYAGLDSLAFNCRIKSDIRYRVIIFLYSLYPYLEDTKDALCYKFRRLTIDQNCSAMCTNKGGHSY